MSTKKISFNIKTLENDDSPKKRNILFRSKTLGIKSKYNKLIQSNINIQKCFQTMKNQISKRGIIEIENCKNIFKTFNSFYSYTSLNNNQDESDHLLSEIAWVIFHRKYKKNMLIKKPGEKSEFFYLLMKGKIQKVSLVFKREKITLKEYLIYLLKMKLLKEYELLRKCRLINKSIMNINYDNIEYFCEKNPKYEYSDLLKIATDDIKNLGFDLRKINHNDECEEIPSIQNYLDVGEIKKDIKSQINKGPTIYLYIPKYELSRTLTEGDYFGYLTNDKFNEYSSYICIEDCDMGFINKSKIVESPIFELTDLTISNYFSKNKNKYYIFKDIDSNLFNEKYATFINYQKYKKGDKIFLQGSLNEGIYLIKDGEIKISAYTKLNDLTKLMLKLIWSLKGFQEHVPPSDFNNIAKENNDKDNNIIKKDVISYDEKISNFDFGVLKEGDILGLNELYDYNTTIYNFSAECISDEVNLFFINKNNFNLILGKEKSLYSSVIQKVELRIKYMIGCIKKLKKSTAIDVNIKKKNEISKIEQINIYNYNSKNKPIICKNLKRYINYKILDTTQEQNISNNSNKKGKKKVQNIPSIKNQYKNKSTFHLNTINNNMTNIREKLFNNDFLIKSYDKILHDKIYNNNNRVNNFNNFISSNVFKFFTDKKPNFYQEYLKESKLAKNKTYNRLVNNKSVKNDYQLYNFTTPNKSLKKNSKIFIFNKTIENKKEKLPLLGKDFNKKNINKNRDYFKTLNFI